MPPVMSLTEAAARTRAAAAELAAADAARLAALPPFVTPGARVAWDVPHVGPAVVEVLTVRPFRISYRHPSGHVEEWTAYDGRDLADVLPPTLRPAA